jgi:hypothetical protein
MAKNSTAALAASVNVVPLRPDASNGAPLAVPSLAAGYPELRYMGSTNVARCRPVSCPDNQIVRFGVLSPGIAGHFEGDRSSIA